MSWWPWKKPDIVIDHERPDGSCSGFGDALACAWLSEGAKAGPVTVGHYFKPGPRRQFLEAFGQTVVSSPEGAVYLIEQGNEDGMVGRVRSWNRSLGLESTPARPMYRTPPTKTLEWGKGVVDEWRKQNRACTVCVFAWDVTHANRAWPIHSWIDLIWHLGKSGIASIILTFKEELPLPKGHPVKIVRGGSWDEFYAVMTAGDLVVGLENGPAFFAGTVGCRTLALFGAGSPFTFLHDENIKIMRARPDEISCVGCNFNVRGGYRPACDIGCQALYQLSAERVARGVLEVLSGRRPEGPPVAKPPSAASSVPGPLRLPNGETLNMPKLNWPLGRSIRGQ